MRRTRSFAEASHSVPEARQFVGSALDRVAGHVCETAVLLVSELATNAVQHAKSAFDVTVIFPTAAGNVRVEVTDHDRTPPKRLWPPPTVPHGRGLQLIAHLSQKWGVREKTTRPGGKTVWFELTVPKPPGQAGRARPKEREARQGRRA